MRIFIFLITILFMSSSIAFSKECSSDFGCGIGSKCVKKLFKSKGVCMKSVDDYGNKKYDIPSTDSVGPKMKNGCQFNTDCPIGFRCDRKYKECIKKRRN